MTGRRITTVTTPTTAIHNPVSIPFIIRIKIRIYS